MGAEESSEGKAPLDFLSNVVQSNPTPKGLTDMGDIYAKIGKYELALDQYQKAIDLDISFDLAYFSRGGLFTKLSKFDLAAADFSQAIRINDKDHEAFYNRAMCFWRLGNIEESLNDYSEAIKLNPDFSEAFFSRAFLYYDSEPKRLELAIKDFTYLIETLGRGDYKSYHMRGSCYSKSKDYDSALRDFSKAIQLNPFNHKSFNARARVYLKQKRYEESEKDFLRAIELNPDESLYLCNIGQLFADRRELRRSEEYFKKAINLSSNEATIYGMKIQALVDLKVEENASEDVLEDYAKMIRFSADRDDHDHERNESDGIKNLYKSLENQKSRHWYPFLKDFGGDEETEKQEITELRRELQGKGFDDLISFRFIGSGVFGLTYLCRISRKQGIFVLKIFRNSTISAKSIEQSNKMIEKDAISTTIPYHRNVVPILRYTGPTQRIKLGDLPDYTKTRDYKVFGQEEMIGGIILMKYYPKDLEFYIKQRVGVNERMKELEICYILRGLLRGAKHLHDNMIVHRDIKGSNVFVNELYGRVFLGDFGCCLDLRSTNREKDDFQVHEDDELIWSMYSGSSRFMNLGADGCLAPEIEYFEENSSKLLDYSKSDLFSIGMIGYGLVSSFVSDLQPFGGKYPLNCEKMEDLQSHFVDIEEKYCDPKVASFIKSLLTVDPAKRIDYQEAVDLADQLVAIFEEKECISKYYNERANIVSTKAKASSERNQEQEQEGEFVIGFYGRDILRSEYGSQPVVFVKREIPFGGAIWEVMVRMIPGGGSGLFLSLKPNGNVYTARYLMNIFNQDGKEVAKREASPYVYFDNMGWGFGDIDLKEFWVRNYTEKNARSFFVKMRVEILSVLPVKSFGEQFSVDDEVRKIVKTSEDCICEAEVVVDVVDDKMVPYQSDYFKCCEMCFFVEFFPHLRDKGKMEVHLYSAFVSSCKVVGKNVSFVGDFSLLSVEVQVGESVKEVGEPIVMEGVKTDLFPLIFSFPKERECERGKFKLKFGVNIECIQCEGEGMID